MSFEDKLDMLVRRHDELRDAMARPDAGSEYARLSKEFSDLTPVVESIQTLKASRAERKGTAEMLADPACDPEMKRMAEEELRVLDRLIPDLTRRVQLSLLPKDA